MSDWSPKHEYDPLAMRELFRLWDAGMIPKPNLRRLNRLVARFNREPSAKNGTQLLDVIAIMAGRPRTGGR